MSHVATTIIRAEHRSLSAVIHGLQYFAGRARRNRPVDSKVVSAMLYYIDLFPDRFHHPKEEQYLFKKLCDRSADAQEVVHRLEQDHSHGKERVRELQQLAIRLEHGDAARLGTFAAQVDQYAQAQWNHMRLEEDSVLRLAEQCLTEEDWDEIGAAFADNADPLLGAEAKEDYDELFTKIVDLMPAPVGQVLSWHAAAQKGRTF